MKIIYENGDEVFYNDERCVVMGLTKHVNGMDAIHIHRPNGDILLVPTTAVNTLDAFLLGKCLECLRGYEQWEANLTVDDDADILESMSVENYEMLIGLQDQRNDIGKFLPPPTTSEKN